MSNNNLRDYTYAYYLKDKCMQGTDYPSDTKELKISCTRDVNEFLDALKVNLDLPDMNISTDNNGIHFEGIFPDDTVNEDTILEAVQVFDGTASILW